MTVTIQMDEALRRVVAADLGPRREGVVYINVDGAFKVLRVILDPAEARSLLNRRSALFAIEVIDIRRSDAQPFHIGSVWTTSDYVAEEVAS